MRIHAVWSGLVNKFLENHLKLEARELTKVSDGTSSNYCPPLHGASLTARAKRTRSPGRRSHEDQMHRVDKQTLVRQRREDGLETLYGSLEPVRHDHLLPPRKVDCGEMERSLRVWHGRRRAHLQN